MMQKKHEKLLKPRHMGTHLRVLEVDYQMDTNMTVFRWFSKFVVLWTKVFSALEGLKACS